MHTYTEVHITGINAEVKDILLARLFDFGYDGFLEEDDNLKAYIDTVQFDIQVIDHLRLEIPFSYLINEIAETNWNAQWESSFEPVRIDNFVAVRADFHDVVENVEHEIIITPKMSFGTGHHATTHLMMNEMRSYDWAHKKVLDFGSGTGILAILASKLGAANVVAIDNDPWCIENGKENIQRNAVENIQMLLNGEIPPQQMFDIMLANINKHILLQNAKVLMGSLNEGGSLIMSGLLEDDIGDIKTAYSALGEPVNLQVRNNWVLMSFMK